MKLQRERQTIESALRSFKQQLLQLPKQVQDKGGNLGPLTDLDRYVDQELYRVVQQQFPGDGWLSEESPREGGNGRLWIIDPVDGTREIVAGIPEWAISVGLWENGKLLYGWLYNAMRDILWQGGPGLGAWANQSLVQVKEPGLVNQLRIGISRTDIKKGLVPNVEPAPVAIGSIAYKLGLVAAGEIDATVSVTPKNSWDIAGGIAIVLGAGGSVIEYKSGASLTTLPDPHSLQEGGLVAGHPAAVEKIRALYSKQKA